MIALAERYRRSKAGRVGGGSDFLADFRELLRAASSEDGEARERADEEIRRAARVSDGLLSLDFHPKDPRIIHRVRLRPGGESWLFEQVGEPPPSERRARLAGFFEQQAQARAPHPGWRSWFAGLASNARSGAGVLPFERDDAAFNARLARCVAGVLEWQGESLVRYASATLCGDSKWLEHHEARVLAALRGVTGSPECSLETFQILKSPRSVLVHGPLVLTLGRGTLDLGLLAGPVAVSGIDIDSAVEIQSSSPVCLTVENEGVFRELAKRNPGIVLIHTSFPGAATRSLLLRLPAAMVFHHFGDTDPAGFDILRHLRELAGRPVWPLGMDFRPHPGAAPLTDAERRTLGRLIAAQILTDQHPTLQRMLDVGNKGAFEQESLGPAAAQALMCGIAGNPPIQAPG
jgi:hypothetical protein